MSIFITPRPVFFRDKQGQYHSTNMISDQSMQVAVDASETAVEAADEATQARQGIDDAVDIVTDAKDIALQAATDASEAAERAEAATADMVKISPQTFTAEQQAQARANIGAVGTSRTINGKPLSSDVTLNPTDVGAVPPTRTVNGYTLDDDIELGPADVGAVPPTRTVNGKALSGNIALTASDVHARPDDWVPTPAEVDAVPTARKVNGKALTSDITLSPADINAVPTTRTINNKQLNTNIALSAADIGARPDTWKPTPAEIAAAPVAMVSDAWTSGHSYTKGDYALHNNILWKCLQDTNSAVPQTGSAYWSATTIGKEIAGITPDTPIDLGADGWKTYFNVKSDYSKSSTGMYKAQKFGRMVRIEIEFSGTFTSGLDNKFATATNKTPRSFIGMGRVGNPEEARSYPATLAVDNNGDIRCFTDLGDLTSGTALWATFFFPETDF